MSSYTQQFTVRFRNGGVGPLFWKAEVVEDGEWPDGSGVYIEWDTGETYDGRVVGPLDYDEDQTLILKCTAVDGMKKASSPYSATFTVWGWRDRNKISSAATVIQTGRLYIFSGGILAFDLGGDLSIETHTSQTNPVTDTILLGNVGDIPVNWELLVTFDAALNGNLEVTPSSGALGVLDNVTITMSLTNPSLLAQGVYTGLVVASDPDGWSDSVSVPIEIIVNAGFPEVDVSGILAWSFLESSTPDVKEITISNVGSPGSSLNWTYEVTGDLAGVIELNPSSGSIPEGSNITVDVTLLDGEEMFAGSYTGTLRIKDTVYSEAEVVPVDVPITVTVRTPAYLIVTDRTGSPTTKAWFNVGTKWYDYGTYGGKPRWKPTSYSAYIRWANFSGCGLGYRYYIENSGLFWVPIGIRGNPDTWLSGAGMYQGIDITTCALQADTVTFAAGE